jgi:hypothetical protein
VGPTESPSLSKIIDLQRVFHECPGIHSTSVV